MSLPSGCDWWTRRRLRMYGHKVCPICKGTWFSHIRITYRTVKGAKVTTKLEGGYLTLHTSDPGVTSVQSMRVP